MRPEQLALFASDDRAPLKQRAQARTELETIYKLANIDMPSRANVKQVIDAVLEWQADQQFAKATQLQPLMSGVHRGPREPKSVLVDETSGTLMAGGYYERPGLFGFEHCRVMVENTSMILGAILRRDRQVKRFLRSFEKGRDLYFEVRKGDTDTTGQGQRGREERALEQFIMCSRWERRPHLMKDLGREPLKDTVVKGVRDLMTYDAWAVETIPTRNNKMLDGFATIDASTVRLAAEDGYNGDDKAIAIQLVAGNPLTTYSYYDLIYTCMNPRSDLRVDAPPEMIVKIVTGWLNAMTYNSSGFDKNAIPKGLLTVVGSYDQKQADESKRAWNSMVKGINNQWALPVLFSENKEGGASFERFGIEFNEMYFAKWMVWIMSIIALVYGMDPCELYSESFTSGRSSLSGSDRAELSPTPEIPGASPS